MGAPRLALFETWGEKYGDKKYGDEIRGRNTGTDGTFTNFAGGWPTFCPAANVSRVTAGQKYGDRRDVHSDREIRGQTGRSLILLAGGPHFVRRLTSAE